jgi:hypothetical protein
MTLEMYSNPEVHACKIVKVQYLILSTGGNIFYHNYIWVLLPAELSSISYLP